MLGCEVVHRAVVACLLDVFLQRVGWLGALVPVCLSYSVSGVPVGRRVVDGSELGGGGALGVSHWHLGWCPLRCRLWWAGAGC